jgi:hypothetical protein
MRNASIEDLRTAGAVVGLCDRASASPSTDDAEPALLL